MASVTGVCSSVPKATRMRQPRPTRPAWSPQWLSSRGESVASSPTPTGTASGTRRSRPSGCGSSTCSTTCSRRSRPTRRSPTSCSTGRWRWSTTTSPCGPRPRRGCAGWPPRAAWPWGRGTSSWTSSSCRARRSCATCSSGSSGPPRFGGAMPVGYLPDMFGHIAQMPQLLQPVRLRRTPSCGGACRAAVDRTAFWWSAPTARTVRAEYLPEGYGNGARAARRRQGTARARIGALVDGAAATCSTGAEPVLWMNGTDHLVPQPWLGRLVAEAERPPGRLRHRRHARSPSTSRPRRADGLPSWQRRAALGRAAPTS